MLSLQPEPDSKHYSCSESLPVPHEDLTALTFSLHIAAQIHLSRQPKCAVDLQGQAPN